jgi:hypothetical protein
MPRHPGFKLGRKAREHDPRFPHYSALVAGQRPTTMPAPMDWSAKMPPDLGMMLNDQLSDCTCAAVYHLIQLWSFNTTGQMLTEPDTIVLKAYELIDGYDPSDPSTDQGGIIQHVMRYWLREGVPMMSGVNKALAVIETDPQNDIDVTWLINDCAAVNIGFNVPEYILPDDGSEPPFVWDVNPHGDNTIIGGHDVIAPGFTANATLNIISWGSRAYTMTKAFRNQFVTEMYAIADPSWINAKGTTPGGLTLAQLEQQMQALRG